MSTHALPAPKRMCCEEGEVLDAGDRMWAAR